MERSSNALIREVVAKLGGAARVSAALDLGTSGPSRVRNWGHAGGIPGRYWLALERLAAEQGVDLTVADLAVIATVPRDRRAA